MWRAVATRAKLEIEPYALHGYAGGTLMIEIVKTMPLASSYNCNCCLVAYSGFSGGYCAVVGWLLSFQCVVIELLLGVIEGQ